MDSRKEDIILEVNNLSISFLIKREKYRQCVTSVIT